MFQELQPFAISLIIGLLIGIERERSQVIPLQLMGVRSFVFIALLGTLVAWLHEFTLLIVVSVFVFALMFASFLRALLQKQKPVSIITELAAGVVYCLGYMVVKTPLLAVVIGTAVLLVLLGSQRLHEFSRKQLSQSEIHAAVVILVLAFVILPFLPNHPIDPWQLFNPQRLGIIVVLIAGMQFGGYVAIRVFGSRLGMIFLGFFGGLISSTAVFVTLPKIVKQHPQMLRPVIAGAIFSIIAMLGEIVIIIILVAPDFLVSMLWPILSMAVVGVMIALLVNHQHGKDYILPTTMNPLDIKSVFKLALIVFAMLVFVAAATKYFGSTGGWAASFFGGLFELHSVTLATSTLYAANKILIAQARWMLALALLASFISKFFLLAMFARNRFGALTALGLGAILATGSTVFLLT